MKSLLLVAFLALATGLLAQTVVPAGTILPLQLNSSLNSVTSKPGQVITARVMQDVPLPSGGKVHAGSKVIGRILEVTHAGNGKGARISLQFDKLKLSKRVIPITTNLRALASMMEVEAAQVPQSGPDRGTSEDSWTTLQVGGDVVYRGGGPVTNAAAVVGKPVPGGVLVRIASGTGNRCRGDLAGNDQPQALWVFSSDACGTYGFPDLTILHAGRSDPVGKIALGSESAQFDVRSGSGLLLRVQ
jgi:hypothetical protein